MLRSVVEYKSSIFRVEIPGVSVSQCQILSNKLHKEQNMAKNYTMVLSETELRINRIMSDRSQIPLTIFELSAEDKKNFNKAIQDETHSFNFYGNDIYIDTINNIIYFGKEYGYFELTKDNIDTMLSYKNV